MKMLRAITDLMSREESGVTCFCRCTILMWGLKHFLITMSDCGVGVET